MDLQDYIHAVDQYVLEEFIDTPHTYDAMMEIIAVQFYKNEIPFKYACNFAQLILDVEIKAEFDYTLIYEPFKVLEEGTDEQWQYKYDPNVNFESFEIILDGEKRIDINYIENLNYRELVKKISKLDKPAI